jgi:hypothetical protein
VDGLITTSGTRTTIVKVGLDVVPRWTLSDDAYLGVAVRLPTSAGRDAVQETGHWLAVGEIAVSMHVLETEPLSITTEA